MRERVEGVFPHIESVREKFFTRGPAGILITLIGTGPCRVSVLGSARNIFSSTKFKIRGMGFDGWKSNLSRVHKYS